MSDVSDDDLTPAVLGAKGKHYLIDAIFPPKFEECIERRFRQGWELVCVSGGKIKVGGNIVGFDVQPNRVEPGLIIIYRPKSALSGAFDIGEQVLAWENGPESTVLACCGDEVWLEWAHGGGRTTCIRKASEVRRIEAGVTWVTPDEASDDA